MGVNFRIRVNPIKCEGRGLCTELFPERMSADDWGYPIVAGEAFASELLPQARLAAKRCPLLALEIYAETRGGSGHLPTFQSPRAAASRAIRLGQ